MKYLSTLELAKRINKSPQTILGMVKKGMVIPINKDTYLRDGGYRFTEEECLRLEQKFNQGPFLSEAAKIVGITPQYLSYLSKIGKINSEIVIYGKQERRKFDIKDLLQLKEAIKNGELTTSQRGKKVTLYKNNLRLFDIFEYHSKKVRVINCSPIELLTETGDIIKPKEVLHYSEPWPDKPYQRKRGFIEFIIPIPRDNNHLIYKILSTIINSIGQKNIKIYENYGNYYVRCRQDCFPGTEEEYNLLLAFLQEGNMEYSNGFICLQPDIVPVTINLPGKIVRKINKLNQNKEEWIRKLIMNELKDKG